MLIVLKRMNKLVRNGLFVAVALLVGLGAGCKKKPAAAGTPAGATETGPVTASKLSGAKEVIAALEKKNYDGVIAGLVSVRQNVADSQQQVEFATLVDEVKIKLLEVAPQDPNAGRALAALRMMTGGR
ncbi:MAG: hypothetical protein HY674_01970 [Chloroflexi bacterium]|nr:hypothetical protein [Chloroflexota bacterium]